MSRIALPGELVVKGHGGAWKSIVSFMFVLCSITAATTTTTTIWRRRKGGGNEEQNIRIGGGGGDGMK